MFANFLAHAEVAAESGPAFPTFIVGVIAFVIFIALALVTWSYRDVANRHDHKGSSSHH